MHTHTTHNQHGCIAPLSLLPLFVPSIVFNDCATRGCFCCAPAKFATVSCAHNYVAAQKCCLPTGAHTKHTDKLAGSSSSVCSCCCSCCSCSVCVWHTLMTHTSCCTRVATLADAATTTSRGCCRRCYCCWLHIFLVIKITLKQQAEAGEGAMNERQTLPLRRGNKLVDWRMHVYECVGVRIALCVYVCVYVCVCLL